MPQEWEAADGEDTPKKDQLSSYSRVDSFVKLPGAKGQKHE